MAIVKKNTSAKLRLTNSQHKTISTFSGINPEVNENTITTFSEGINMLRKDAVGFKFLVTESELVSE